MTRMQSCLLWQNPVPEIMPDLAKAAGAKVVGTGRSELPDQVNTLLLSLESSKEL